MVKINLTSWPAGLGLDIETDTDCYCFAGAHGGGIGTTQRAFILTETRAKELVRILQSALRVENPKSVEGIYHG